MSQLRGEFTPGEEPLLSIGAVSRMTDIPETTLRVWERRYGFPQSARTAGGHRLYSQQEVMRIQWVKLRVDEGTQVSLAIRALHRAEQESDLLDSPIVAPAFSRRGSDVNLFGSFHQRLLDALLQHDPEQANQVLAEATAIFPLEFIVLEVIGPTLYDIGEVWSKGEIDMATEHFATNHLRHHLLMWIQSGPPAYHVNPVALACAPGELHEGSLLMLAVLLRRLRWPVVYLGQNTPLSDLAAFLDDVNAAIIVFVAMTEETASALADWPRWMPEIAQSKQPVVSYGGRVFAEKPELVEQMPGIYLGNTLTKGVETLNRLLHEMNPLLR
ncbi:MAG: B12-binding domain-containing protein [Chloroflexota bacterium]